MADTRELDKSIAAAVGEDITLAQFNESQLGVVAVGKEV